MTAPHRVPDEHDYEELRADVRSWLRTQPSTAEVLSEMVAVPSLPGTLLQNDVADLTVEFLGGRAGVTTHSFVPDWAAVADSTSPMDDQRLWCPLEPQAEYAEVLPELRVTVLQQGNGAGRTLMLNGHVDVVPADNQDWTGPPFEPRIRDGVLVARGAMDMKAGVVAAALAFAYVADRWTGPGLLQLALVPEEETGGDGMLALLHHGYRPDAVVFAEPTDLQVVHRHVGIQRFDVHVPGLPGGMLRRSWGASAVGPTARIAVALEELEASRTSRAYSSGGYDPDDLPGFINLTMQAGDWIATRAASGQVSGLMGVLPDETQAQAAAELTDTVRRVAPDAEVTVWSGGHRGGELPITHPLVSAYVVPSAAAGSPGAPTRAGTMVCDAKIVQGGGWAPAVVLGPSGGGLHSPDEWVDLASIAVAVELLASGAIRFLAGD